MSVLALGMSRPDSMMEVHSSTSISRAVNWSITRDSSCSSIWPWATPMRASGTSCSSLFAHDADGSAPGCGRRTPGPSRSSSRRMAWRTSRSLKGPLWLTIGRRSSGGVLMVEMSRTPVSDRYSVRGMGWRSGSARPPRCAGCLKYSLWVTPKRCSSSMITRPRFLNVHVLLQQAVGADDDIDLAVCQPATIASASARERKRESISTWTG